jgi:hypothetical protein
MYWMTQFSYLANDITSSRKALYFLFIMTQCNKNVSTTLFFRYYEFN